MKDRRWIALCAIGLVVLVTMNLPDSASSRVEGAVRDGLSPLQAVLRGGVREGREIIRYIQGIGDLVLENRALSEEIVYLRGEMRMARELERDNQMLRDLLGFVERFPKQLVSCEVIGRDSTGWWQTIRLGKGAEAGVAEGRAVITPDGLLGRTAGVSAHTADVLLLSDVSCQVSVRLARSGVFGIMEGLGAKPDEQPACRIRYISRTADIQAGDEVVTSGMGGVFPKGLLVGWVVRVEAEPSGLYQTAWVDVAAKLGRSEYAFVAATEADLAAAATGMIEDLIAPVSTEIGGESP
ncbi:MAG: rod shape-determining protein MreC [Kiritimatiellae bacterium]|jgi:rod shape-determining protein MreC|nr:rod shape-determining protein MreC [Kiritimatiellia bacterium]MDD4341683.1 rod shape-determining protein MreC [Kiritimatiellia bacterium]MDY0148665.1 rod shape-determining protein MreC [Kiritimatiellia bacterium]